MGFFYVNCPHCKAELEVEDQYSGQTMTCPFCNEEFVPLVGAENEENTPPEETVQTEDAPQEKEPPAQSAPFAAPITDKEGSSEYPAIEEDDEIRPDRTFCFLAFFDLVSRIGAILIVLCGIALITCGILRWNGIRKMPLIPAEDTLRLSLAAENVSGTLEALRTEAEKFRKTNSSARISKMFDSAPDKITVSAFDTVSSLEGLRNSFESISDFEKNIRGSLPAGSQIGQLSLRLKNEVQAGRILLEKNIAYAQKNSYRKINARIRILTGSLIYITFTIVLAALLPALGSCLNRKGKN